MFSFSAREWFGMLAAVAWGAVIGLMPLESWGMFGIFFVVLVGPPIAFLMLPRRPILSWQIPILATSISACLMMRDPQDPNDSAIIPALFLLWPALMLFSAPWPFIFQRRAQRAREEPDSGAGTSILYSGAGLLVFLACGLIIVGSILAVAGIFISSPASHPTVFDRVAPFLGWLMATAGMGLAVRLCSRKDELGISKSVENVIGVLLALLSIELLPLIWMDLFDAVACAPGDINCNPARESDLFWPFVISLEAVAILVWLIRRGWRAKTASAGRG
jgi:hypothetical protein